MRFVVVTHSLHKIDKTGRIGGYGPYVREMNLWAKNAGECNVIAPVEYAELTGIDETLSSPVCLTAIPRIAFVDAYSSVRSVLLLPYIFVRIFMAMYRADHIHVRCPGNIGLIGVIVQCFFPGKRKTAKYAGNWDRASKQPLSYRLQRWILSNTLLTKNIRVLVYGEWPGQSRNILPFFTATFSEREPIDLSSKPRGFPMRLVFVGKLSINKNPLLAIRVLHSIVEMGISCRLDLLGDGPQREELEQYVLINKLTNWVRFHGDCPLQQVKIVLQESHFLTFFSKSEGWPKAVAEAMYFGCVPVTTRVSCVPWMLGQGVRGILVGTESVAEIAVAMCNLYERKADYHRMSSATANWSQQYTVERFEKSISSLL